jgi:hypothetical protein
MNTQKGSEVAEVKKGKDCKKDRERQTQRGEEINV